MKHTTAIITLFIFLSIPASSLANAVPTSSAHLRQTELSVKALPATMKGIPRGAIRVKMLPLQFRASCKGGVKVKYIRVKRISLGDSADIKGVYVMNGDRRITSTTTFSSDDQSALLRLNNVRIPACKSVQLDVTVDFRHGATVGGRFSLRVESADNIIATANKIEGDFPLRSHEPAPSITPDPVGTAVIEFLPVGGAINAVRDELLGKFTVEAQGNTHQVLHSITLTNNGSARDDDLRNMYLTHSRGRALTPVANELDGDKVTLRFSRPFFLRKGQKMKFRLRGSAYSTSKTIKFGLEEPSDLHAIPSRRGGRKLGSSKRRNRILH